MPDNTNRKTGELAVDVLSVIAGALLFLSPWLFGFAAEAAASWNAWIIGALIAAVAVGALVRFRAWEEWVNLILGVWSFAAPWLLGFAGIAAAVTIHMVVGGLVAVFAAYELWTSRNRPLSAA